MKKFALLSLIVIFMTGVTGISAQDRNIQSAFTGMKDEPGFRYGDDVVINNAPDQDQRMACLTVAFNGWMYAGYVSQSGNYFLYRSTDDGASWQEFEIGDAEIVILNLDIVACGNSESDLRLIVAYVYYHDVLGEYHCNSIVYNGVSGEVVDIGLMYFTSNPIVDIDIVSDYRFPSPGASPYSVGILFAESKAATDELKFSLSTDGGLWQDFPIVVRSTSSYIRELSLAYAVCPSMPQGRYFAAWAEYPGADPRLGQVYVAYTYDGIAGDFTTPLRIDALSPLMQGKCSNPSIACQFTDLDNNMGNLTTIVMVQRAKDGSPDDGDIMGFYNKESVFTNNWDVLSVAYGANNEIQPDITFDPWYCHFLLTYCDSTAQKLPYRINHMDLGTPNEWPLITAAYNDDASGLEAPYPKVEINPLLLQAAHVWISDLPSGNGVLMFDAEYSTVGELPRESRPPFTLHVSPNPCRDGRIRLVMSPAEQVRADLRLYDSGGRIVAWHQSVTLGPAAIEIEVPGIRPGVYFLVYSAGNYNRTLKVIMSPDD